MFPDKEGTSGFEDGIHNFLKDINVMWDFELSDQINIVFSRTMEKRDKVVLLLSHMEPLI